MYFGNYTHLMYMHQFPERDESELARSAARRLDVQYVEVNPGLGVLEKRLCGSDGGRAEE